MTSIMINERASREKATAGAKPPTCIHVQSVWVKTRSWGGEAMKLMPIRTVRTADSPTEPAPMIAATGFGSPFPAIARTRNPAKGRAGMSHRRFSMSAFHGARCVGIQRFEVMVEQDHERQADGDLGRGHGEDKDKHNLAVDLPPARPGDDEGKAHGVQHDLDGHEHEHDVP